MKLSDCNGIWLITQIKENLNQTPKIYLYSGYNNFISEFILQHGIIKVFSKASDFIEIATEIIKHS